jgi:hypothetical protein
MSLRSFFFLPRAALVLLLAWCAVLVARAASAETNTTPPPPSLQVAQPESPPRGPHHGPGSAWLEGGVAVAPGQRPGAYGLLAGTALHSDAGGPFSPLFSLWYGYEAWGAAHIGGVAMPVGIRVGLRARAFVLTTSVGANLFTVDGIGDKAAPVGGGIFSPRLDLGLGVRLGNFYAGIAGNVQRRWQWKRDAFTLFHAGLALGVMTDSGKRDD